MSYQIKISYSDGDSESTWDSEEYVNLEWENLDVAKENLKRIKQHYKEYEFLNGWHSWETTNKEFNRRVENLKKFPWHSPPDWHSAIILKTDSGENFTANVFWCGYFERLKSAEIVDEFGGDDYKFRTEYGDY